MRVLGVSLFLLTAVLICISAPLLADVNGTIRGVVTDATGASVPGASVTLKNSVTGFTRHATTDASGAYEFLAVPVGTDYSVQIEFTGFEVSTQSGIALDANQNYLANFQLVVGSLSQKVEVTAASAQVETTSMQMGDVIGSTKMTDLPLNGRSYLDLLGLQAGVVPISSGTEPADRTVSGTIGNAGYFSVNGNREAANAFLVNGGDVEEGRLNGASVVPTLDSLEEFRLLTNSFDAEYGRFSGGVVNAVTKSGTNSVHGTVFEFVRNNDFDSRKFFEANQFNPTTGQEIPGSARGSFKQNQFGFAFGGPLLKNRVFFFTDYQGTRQVRGLATGNLYVPSDQERAGDFSDFATTGVNALSGTVHGSSVAGSGAMNEVLSNRLGYQVNPGEPYWVQGCSTLADAQAGMCVFPNNVIPQSAWGPVAKATLKFIPMPTAAPGGVPIFSTSANNQRVLDDKIGERIDLDSQRVGRFSLYYHYDDSNLKNPYPGANLPGFPATTLTRAQQANMGYTHNFGATAVNELRLNYTRMGLHLDQPTGGVGDISSFGFVKGGLGIIPVDPGPPYEGMPLTCLNLLGDCIGLPSLSTGQFNNTAQISDNYSKVVGRHTMKFGAEYRYLQINERNVCAPNGNFSFSGTETGNDFADFLLGAVDPGGAVQCSNQYLDSRTKYSGAYGQDTFKVKSNLTLNYGLRWEFSQPFYDTQGKIQAFVPGEQSHVYPDAPTGWVFPGDPGIPKTLAPTRYRNFGPRLGLAYSPDFSEGVLGKIFGGPGKTSIRVGSGIYYTSVEDLTLFYEVGDAPFGLYFPVPGRVYLEEPYKSRTGPPDPGQRFPFAIPKPGSTGIWPQFLPISGSPGYQTTNVLPYAEHFNLTVQRELSRSTILSIGYVGTRGHHLIAQYSFNPGNPARCLQIANAFNAAGLAGQGCGPGGEDSIYSLGSQTFYGTRPYSITSGRYAAEGLLDFGSNTWESTMANSNYNSLQTSLQRQMGRFKFLAAYTFSKSLDNASGYNDSINPYDFNASKGLSGFDLTHNFVFSYSYTMPLEKMTHAGSGVLRKSLEGWELSGITRFTTGLPVGLGNSGDWSLCGCGGVDLPNWTGQKVQVVNPRSSANHTWFVENYTTDAEGNPVPTSPFWSEAGHNPYISPIMGVPGDADRRFFHGPGLNNWDLALHKMTRITEGTSLEFRAEFFNVFNHAQFTSPGGNVSSTHFGEVSNTNDPRIGQLALKLHF
jgi:hypothetical protein